jgi:propionyl-CoA carboxylase alpha chain
VIRSVLIANRGEIARRVMGTCRHLGIATVAVHSDADAQSPHVGDADSAVALPGDVAADTYLRGDLIIDAARRAGADAIHPGYGFLSENADFAAAVLDAGLTWIGPSPTAIAAMGSKIEAKRLMSSAGVPVLPELAPRAVTADDLPVLVKASAGGGGRGMRVVRSLDVLEREVASASAEAASAFGDATVFCEPYLATGHHVEVQIVADEHGTVWALGERECSIQRRHQKLIEEAPSPLVDRVDGMRDSLCTAAIAATRAIGYTGVGTVEFLADDDGTFFFLEMNTRLQVEHPVTECTTGIDLVAMQITVAEGGRLDPAPPASSGHAIEARVYAEDPGAGWQPNSGTVHTFDVPGIDVEFTISGRPGIRLDSGVVAGTAVSTHYDPLLAKFISSAPTRGEAARALAGALARARIHGVVTNRDLLVRTLRHPAFLAGDTDTSFFDRHGLAALAEPLAGKDGVRLSALAAALADAASNRAGTTVLSALPSGWRNLPSAPQRKSYAGPDGDIDVDYRLTRDGLVADGFADVAVVDALPERVVLDVDGVTRAFAVVSIGADRYVDSSLGAVTLHRIERFADPADHVAAGSLLAPMPGAVARVVVAVGDRVERGQPLLWMEAMKMQHQIDAPATGIVTELPVQVGQQVDVGTVLAVVESEPGEAPAPVRVSERQRASGQERPAWPGNAMEET